jgi:endonuclease/exonuclease/phosphatase family metal-dependent hydrolase
MHQLDTLATRLGYATAARAVNWDERYLPFPYGMPSVHFGRVLSGQAVLSRYPIRTHERIELSRTSRSFLTDAFYLDRLAQVAIADIGGWPLAIINVHLEAFEMATREQQAEEVRALAVQFMNEGMPVLLIGDFNSVMPASKTALPSSIRKAFMGDDTMQTILRGTGLRPAIGDEAALVSGANVGTFPADDPNRKIDYVFYSAGRIFPIGSEVLCGPEETPPSDHCAVSFTFGMPRPEQVINPPGTDPQRPDPQN